jgi:molybdopterin converting factor small subunit
MHRRFEFKERVFFELIKRRKVCGRFGPAEFFAGGEVEDLASEAAVAEEGADVVMAGEAPQIKLLPVENRTPRSPRCVERVRILHEIRVARVQGDAAVHGREVVSALSAAQCGLIERRLFLVHHCPVRIMFFAQLREVTGIEVAEIDADGLDRARLWELLEKRWPGLSAHRVITRLARNGVYAEAGEIFGAHDEVALIPPVSGG